ncbi:Sodium/potassium-transporting ATPase subunit alpha [Hypsibius exemplaris]|uniref:Sodium/potassium-transporting ATPase subunit alpha n=1 Tax=Hypsibius exemplaris TaxID=2072580 RepID=A0A1W0X068_HYPEX|nr:Sodium/potassium-transporting ATPase subunit alpha [Hypsibius exemplaris]
MNRVYPTGGSLGGGGGGGRRGSILDKPAVAFDKSSKKQAHEKWKERRQTVHQTRHVVAQANERQKEVDKLNDLKKEVVMGLNDETVTHRLIRDGPNQLPAKKQTPLWLLWVAEMTQGFSLLLWIGGILSILAWGVQSNLQPNTPSDNLVLGIVLIVVVFITGTFSFMQQSKSASIMNSFMKMAPQFAAAVRNGQKMAVTATELVVGDIVELKAGDKIPADIRIVENRGLKVDMASLTGESEPLSRTVEGTNENPLESKNLAFFSTYAVEGSAVGIVIRTGERTTMGRIAKLASTVESDITPLAIEMSRFVHLMSYLAGGMGLILFIIKMGQGGGGSAGMTVLNAIVALIGIVVANVPEGILPATTVALALTAKRMAGMNCLIKNLSAVETLGSTSVICSDKTGTLTQNRMTVAHLWTEDKIWECDTSEDQSKNKLEMTAVTLKALVRCATLCNRAIFKPDQEQLMMMKRETVGDASESALLKFTEVNIGNTVDARAKNPKIAEIPFNSTNKYQLSIHASADYPGENLLVMKGAPERIIDRCKFIEVNGQLLPLTTDWHVKFDKAYQALGGIGERVLGFAQFRLPRDQFPLGFQFNLEVPNFPVEGLTFLGLISLIDPPRAAVPSAVATCQEAGVRVIMVTGDHPITAKAIARTVGIIGPTSETVEDIAVRLCKPVDEIEPTLARAAVVTGSMLKEMSSDQLDFVLRTHPELVFARTSPQQKLIIVEGVQRMGCIVAVTGDGVNDSPALRKADIGIAMGITGSDVSKDAAKMILLDDNFASVVVGIEEGRLIFDNLKKTIAYMLTSNIAEIGPYLTSVITQTPQAIGTAGMLYIDLLTDIAPAIALSYEPSEMDIMKRKPRDPNRDRIINGQLLSQAYGQIGFIQCMAGFMCYFVVFAENGWWPQQIFSQDKEYYNQWENRVNQDMVDSFGQEWTWEQRHEVTLTAQGAFFLTVVITQIGNILNCKCRKMSLYRKGLLR